MFIFSLCKTRYLKERNTFGTTKLFYNKILLKIHTSIYTFYISWYGLHSKQ